jgi:protein O-mannosyl-transferase
VHFTKHTGRLIAVGAFLGGLTVATFWPLTGCDFINYDDTAYVSENPHVLSGLTLASVAWAVRSDCLGNWHPLTMLSHMLDVQLFGLNPGMHHFTSLCLHAANTVLLFLLLDRMTRRLWSSACVAALFALHPLHVESVAWIADRKDLLSTFFGLLCLGAYVRYVEESKVLSLKSKVEPGAALPVSRSTLHAPRFYALSLLFFALALMSKAIAVTLPAVMLLLDWWPLGRIQRTEVRGQKPEGGGDRSTGHASRFTFHVSRLTFHVSPRLLAEKLPFAALAIAATCVSALLLSRAGATSEGPDVGLGVRLARSFIAYQHYLLKMVWPTGLALPYLRPAQWPVWESLSGIALVGALSCAAVWQGRRRPYLLVGWFWFLSTLVPVIGLVPVGSSAVADRYTYFSLVGLFVAGVWAAADVAQGRPYRFSALALAGSAVLVGCLVATHAQLRVWRDSETLYRHALAVTRDNYVAHNGFGLDLFKRGKVDDAISQYEAALQINPLYDVAHSNLGRALAEQKRYDEATGHFETSLSLQPSDAKTRNNFGSLLVLQGRYEEAVRQFEEAVRLQPDHAPAHNNLAISCKKLGRMGEAIAQYREALRLQPDSIEALNNLAWILATFPEAQFRNGTEAVELATRACELTQYQNPIPLGTLATAYAEAGRLQEALSFAERAQELANRGPPALVARMSAMLEAFRAGRPYHATD